ncbi:MAG TPA: toxic anion resistance protein [Candidatus Cybelea sp.]|nr:toxic anion resistance protein [Candidatus Cybelea sp.]
METNLVTADAVALPALAPAAGEVARIKSQINLDDRAQLVDYGAGAQQDVADYAERVLKQTKNRELGDTGALLTDIIMKAKGLDPAKLEEAGFFERLMGSLERRILKFKSKFEEVSGQIEAICIELEKRKEGLKRDIALLDQLHDETAKSLISLTAYIEAGKQYADQYEQNELPKLKAAADQAKPGDAQSMVLAQNYQDAAQALDRLRKRVFYLQQARQIGIQQLPQIRICQSGDETLIESLQASTSLTIPAWKQKMILLLGLNRQKEALALQTSVNEATNEMLRQASEMMKSQAIEIEKQSQEGLVSMETLAKVNHDLIDTIGSVVKVQEDGKAKRAQAEAQMTQMTEDLRKALADAGTRR